MRNSANSPCAIDKKAPSWRTLGAVLAGLAAILSGCDNANEPASGASNAASDQPVPVGVVQVQPRPITVGESFVGRVEGIDNVEIRARVSGFIQERLFKEGQTVAPDTTLFRLERDMYEAIVQQRRADLAAAQAQEENANLQLQRAEELLQRNNIAQATVDERRAAARAATASVLQARAALRQAEINLSYTELKSPIAGQVGRAVFDIGDLVGPESPALTSIISQDPIYVTFPVSQSRLLEVQQAPETRELKRDDFVVHIRLPNGVEYPHAGRVDFIGISVQRDTDTVPVRAILPNPDGLLRDGQFVQVMIQTAQPKSALVVPQSAIQADIEGPFVLAVDQQNRVEVRRIETGDTLERGQVAVSKGLESGDRIIVQGIQRVRPGAPVEPRPAASGAPGT